MGGLQKRGLELPDLPKLDSSPPKKDDLSDVPIAPPKKGIFSFLKKQPTPEPVVLPEPEVISFDQLTQKIESVKMQFENDGVVKTGKEEKMLSHKKTLQKTNELETTSRLLREKDVLLQKKERELNTWEADLRARTIKITTKEEEIADTATANRQTFEKMKQELQEQNMTPNESIDHETIKVLKHLDNLLEKLPKDDIKKFSQSTDFPLYERVMKKYKLV